MGKKKALAVEPICAWDRIPGETPRDYQKFCQYRDMDTGERAGIRTRHLAKLAIEIGFSYDHLKKVSAKNEWTARCAEYDAHLDAKIRAQNEAAIKKMREDHALLASQMLKKAAKRLLTIPEDEITATEIARLVDVGVRIERLSRGESTENKQISGEAKITHQGEVAMKGPGALNLSSLSDEELSELEQLLEKLHPKPAV